MFDNETANLQARANVTSRVDVVSVLTSHWSHGRGQGMGFMPLELQTQSTTKLNQMTEALIWIISALFKAVV